MTRFSPSWGPGAARVPVHVQANDPISAAGIASSLRPRPEVRLVDETSDELGSVTLVVTDDIDEQAVRTIRTVTRLGCPRVVVVAGQLDDSRLVVAVEAGACGLVRRAEATPDRLVASVLAASAGEGTMPPDLLGRLMEQVGRLQRQVLEPRGLAFTGLTHREVEVLRLVADGYGTGEIAEKMSYSERTVKNVLHDVTTRLNLRNRSHAVAYALREGLI